MKRFGDVFLFCWATVMLVSCGADAERVATMVVSVDFRLDHVVD